MKTLLAFGIALAGTVSAAPLIEVGTKPEFTFEHSPIHRPMLGGLSTPAVVSHTLQTKTAPVNYGNLNFGTGMMPSQIVHYGSEYYPDRGYIAPKLISTTGKDVDLQFAHADRARNLLNLESQIGKLDYEDLSKFIDLESQEFDEDSSKWGMGGYPWIG
ncbi:hypothetical protein BGX34_011071 [Mortierella sp. NVP85]|nr:hypothetical protein BGX34_011071 [Mortierella sp. NVP85]